MSQEALAGACIKIQTISGKSERGCVELSRWIPWCVLARRLRLRLASCLKTPLTTLPKVSRSSGIRGQGGRPFFHSHVGVSGESFLRLVSGVDEARDLNVVRPPRCQKLGAEGLDSAGSRTET